jgi:flagellar biosynthesis/type III secretory pathway protein FliH
MALVKQSSLPESVVRFSLRDVETQAQTILHEARREAERIIADAQPVEASAGGEYVVDEITLAIRALKEAARNVQAAVEHVENDALQDVVELALAIAERVTKRSGLVDPNVLAENVREAMKMVVRANGLRVAIHPQQAQTLRQLLPSLQIDWPALANVEIVEDRTVDPGGCRVATTHGQIDATLAAQLDRITTKLIGERGGE